MEKKIQLTKQDGTSVNYTKISEIATSGQANIFFVKDPEGNEKVLKMYLRDTPESISDLEEDVAVKGASREIKVLSLAKQQGRNDIPEIVDWGIVEPGFMNPMPAIVMEPLQGRSLDEIINDKTHNPTIEIFKQIASGVGNTLRWAHKEAAVQPIYHRDISPSNIKITDEGETRLLDWSASRFGSGQTIGNTQWVTPYYTAPEVKNGRTVTPAADQYSLAQTLKSYLLGKDFESVYEGEPPVEAFSNLNIPSHIVTALSKATEEEPENRFNSIDDFVRAIDGDTSLIQVSNNELLVQNKGGGFIESALMTTAGISGGMSIVLGLINIFSGNSENTQFLLRLGLASVIVYESSSALYLINYLYRYKLKKAKELEQKTLEENTEPLYLAHEKFSINRLLQPFTDLKNHFQNRTKELQVEKAPLVITVGKTRINEEAILNEGFYKIPREKILAATSQPYRTFLKEADYGNLDSNDIDMYVAKKLLGFGTRIPISGNPPKEIYNIEEIIKSEFIISEKDRENCIVKINQFQGRRLLENLDCKLPTARLMYGLIIPYLKELERQGDEDAKNTLFEMRNQRAEWLEDKIQNKHLVKIGRNEIVQPISQNSCYFNIEHLNDFGYPSVLKPSLLDEKGNFFYQTSIQEQALAGAVRCACFKLSLNLDREPSLVDEKLGIRPIKFIYHGLRF